jgi:hypothetical protein
MVMRRYSRRFGAVAVAMGLAAALVLGGGPAYAEADKPGPDPSAPAGPVPGGFRTWGELIEQQERLQAAAQRLQDGVGDEAGFTGLEAAPEDGRVRLHWSGEPSDAVRRLVAEVERDAPVEVVAARHSLRDLLAAQGPIAAEAGVGAVVPHVDGSGLTVQYRGSVDEALRLPSVRAASVPVTIEPDETVEPLGCTGRQDDCSPYYGGAKYIIGGGWCSTGFSLKFTSLFGTSPYYRMLSAGHCGSNGTAVTDGGGDSLGTLTGDDDSVDLLLIKPNAGVSLAGRVYVGPWNAGLASNKAIAAATASIVGGWVCTSGAATGEHCNVKITATNVSVNGVNTVQIKEQAGLVAGGKGDSGGPVVAATLGGKVNAKGTISFGNGPVACPAGSPSSACFKTVYYVDIISALAHYKPLFGSVGVMTA